MKDLQSAVEIVRKLMEPINNVEDIYPQQRKALQTLLSAVEELKGLRATYKDIVEDNRALTKSESNALLKINSLESELERIKSASDELPEKLEGFDDFARGFNQCLDLVTPIYQKKVAELQALRQKEELDVEKVAHIIHMKVKELTLKHEYFNISAQTDLAQALVKRFRV